MYEADAQHQDELLKQERLMAILENIWKTEPVIGDDLMFLASALGLTNQLKKYILGK